VPPDYKKGPYSIIRVFDYGTRKMLEDYDDMFEDIFDFDKGDFRSTLNKALEKYASQCGHFSEQELDACIDYYEMRDQK
jgi:hypothetical protein